MTKLRLNDQQEQEKATAHNIVWYLMTTAIGIALSLASAFAYSEHSARMALEGRVTTLEQSYTSLSGKMDLMLYRFNELDAFIRAKNK